MRRYELIFILRPSLGEGEINKVIEYSQNIIGEENGTVIDLNKWGMKKLAYPIKKEIQGYYVFCDYAGTPAAVTEIERRFRIDDAVLKYMTVKIGDEITAEGIQEAIAQTQARNEAVAKQAAEESEAETGEAQETATAGEAAPEAAAE